MRSARFTTKMIFPIIKKTTGISMRQKYGLSSSSRIPSAFVKKINGVTFIDAIALEQSIAKEIPAKNRLREKMLHAGVEFWNKEKTIIKNPIIGINAIGGFSVSLEKNLPPNAINLRFGHTMVGPFTMDVICDGLRETMGVQSIHSFMNPQGKTARELYDLTMKHGHFSITHGAFLGFYMLGISKKAELEFDVQRDLVHLARETSARCAAQDEPTLVALTEAGAAISQRVLRNTSHILKSFPVNQDNNMQDWREERNALYPLSASVSLGLNATLRNYSKMLNDIGGTGKEFEYRKALAMMNDSLHALFPELFKSTSEYGFAFSHDIKKPTPEQKSSLLPMLVAGALATFFAEKTKQKPKQAILLLGAPGVGKSTQTERIVKQMPGVMCISTGNLVRKLNKKVEDKLPLTAIEKKAAESLDRMKQGKLMDDRAVYALLMEHLSPSGEGHQEYSRSHTIILDGVIKASDNIKPFEEALDLFNQKQPSPMSLNHVINLSAPTNELLTRQKARVEKVKSEGGAPRPDDDLNVYQSRLSNYVAQTQAVIDHYQKHSNFVEVVTHENIDETTKDLLQTINTIVDQSAELESKNKYNKS